MQTLSIEQIRKQYPDQWILIGNPELSEADVNDSIVSKLTKGIVLFASKDKREIAYKAAVLKKDVNTTACIYTGEPSKNQPFLRILPQQQAFTTDTKPFAATLNS